MHITACVHTIRNTPDARHGGGGAQPAVRPAVPRALAGPAHLAARGRAVQVVGAAVLGLHAVRDRVKLRASRVVFLYWVFVVQKYKKPIT